MHIAESSAGLAAGSISSVALEHTIRHSVLTGTISDDIWRKEVGRRLCLSYPAAKVNQAMRVWAGVAPEVDTSLKASLSILKGKVRVVLLSNATDRIDAELAALSISSYFDRAMCSCHLGVIKPDKAFFRMVLAEELVCSSEAILIDHDKSSLGVASRMGMRTHHYVNAAALSSYLAPHCLVK